MSRGQKILVTVFAIYAALAGSAMCWAAMTLYGDGLLSLRVHEHEPGGAADNRKQHAFGEHEPHQL